MKGAFRPPRRKMQKRMDAAGAVDAQNAVPTAPTRLVDFKGKREQNESRQPTSHTKFRTLPLQPDLPVSPWQTLCTASRMAGLRKPEDFDVWKLGWELKRRVFAFTATSPASQDRRFCDDIRRAARSGPDLVAEGYYRYNPREFHRFLNDAKASLGEVRNQLLHATDEHSSMTKPSGRCRVWRTERSAPRTRCRST